MGLLKNKYSPERKILLLEDKIKKLQFTLNAYKSEIRKVSQYRVERDLFSRLARTFAASESFEELFQHTIDILHDICKPRYIGIFWLNSQKNTLDYRSGKGYKPTLMSSIPKIGSLMGECLVTQKIVWEPNMRQRSDYVPLNQDPAEYNLICAPLMLFGDDSCVIRLANLPLDTETIAVKVLEILYPLLTSSLERMLLMKKNKQSLQGLKAGFSIARLLENTVSEKDILKNISSKVSEMFSCKGCLVCLIQNETVVTADAWPANFRLRDNEQSHNIYVRNLLESFKDGSTLIKDIQRDRRWSWPGKEVGSLCMEAINFRGEMRGVIIVVGKRSEYYDQTEQSLLGLIATQTSVTIERASYFRKQEELASIDGLTGLYNHRMFQGMLRQEMERSRRYKRPLTLVMLDIDYFKKFNDSYGHLVGDEVIRMVSNIIKKMVRVTDKGFRYGGEEFCVILPETLPENGCIFANRLRMRIEENRKVKNLSVTISLGVTGYINGETAETFIDRVDKTLYLSKDGGRNMVSLQ